MMKRDIIVFTLFFTFSCVLKQNSKFSPIICYNEQTPPFDSHKVSLLNKDGVPYKDTVLYKIKKIRTVFKPCTSYIYFAKYFSKKSHLITESKIKMMATGRRWKLQPELQDELVIQYEFNSSDIQKVRKYKLNKSLLGAEWTTEEKTGIIENVERIWMHPFRSNQFSFTQVAPFPEIKFPLEVGKSWVGQLRIQKGWGDWENTSGSFKYEVVSLDTVRVGFGEINNCWRIESKAKYPFGESYFNYWFHEKLGFVKMEYFNYGGQKLIIELLEIQTKDE